MFTGIIEATGKVISIKKSGVIARLVLEAPAPYRSLKRGSSVAVNGVCLTVAAKKGRTLSFDLIPETLRRTSLGRFSPGERVNLERPMLARHRVHGHFVLGHVDGVGNIRAVRARGRAKDLEVSFPAFLRRFLVQKGSVTVDGVSLTLGRVSRSSFRLHLIPETLRRTTFGLCKKGRPVNLETDILMKGRAARRLI